MAVTLQPGGGGTLSGTTAGNSQSDSVIARPVLELVIRMKYNKLNIENLSIINTLNQ